MTLYRTLALAAALAAASPALAHDGKTHPVPNAADATAAEANVTLYNLEMFEADGTRVAFRDDVLKDRVVVIDFFYTSCGTICPLSGALLAAARDELGAAVGRDVHFISITTDPNTDTPPRIAEYRDVYGAMDGWTVLTGAKGNVDKVLEGLGGYTTNPEDHPNMTLIGDVRSGKWQRLFGLPEPERIVEVVEAFTHSRTGNLAAPTQEN